MADTGWIEVFSDVNSAKHHFEMSHQILSNADFSKDTFEVYQAKMALMHSMQSGYTSLENAFNRILRFTGERSGGLLSPDVLKRVAMDLPPLRPPIISNEMFKHADLVRRFRHIAESSYDDFDVAGSRHSVEAAKALAASISEEIHAFTEVIDPDEDVSAHSDSIRPVRDKG